MTNAPLNVGKKIILLNKKGENFQRNKFQNFYGQLFVKAVDKSPHRMDHQYLNSP